MFFSDTLTAVTAIGNGVLCERGLLNSLPIQQSLRFYLGGLGLGKPPVAAPTIPLLQLDFDVHASWQVELHQGVYRLVGRIHNVHQALVSPNFKLVTTGFVDVR